MRAGQLRHFVTIQEDTGTTVDDHGQEVESWTTYAERWADVRELSGRELWVNQQRWPEVDTQVVMRADAKTVSITPKMRIRFTDRFDNQRTLNILAVHDEAVRGEKMVLKCRRDG